MAREPLDPSTLKDDGRDAWDKQPGESGANYRRFMVFLELGLSSTRHSLRPKIHRPLKQVVEILNAMPGAGSVTHRTIQQLAYEYQWTVRAEEWDADQFNADLDRLRALRAEALERQRKLGLALQLKAGQRLAAIALADITGNELVRMAVEGSRLEMTALGEPDQRVEVSGPQGGPIQTEALDQLTPAQRRERMAEVQEQLARRLGTFVEAVDPDDQVS